MPQVFDLWQDPQERYDIFMNNFTERTWTVVTISEALKELMKTYVQYPPRKLQSEGTRARSRSRTTRSSSTSGRYSRRKASRSDAHGELGPFVGGPGESPGAASSVLAQPTRNEDEEDDYEKTHCIFFDDRLDSVALLSAVAHAQDPLPSWSDGKAKQAIVAFVAKVTKEGSPDFVPPAERIATFDNSDGDLEMLQWTTAGRGARLALIVHHTDAEREWAYDRTSAFGRLDKALDAAQARGWTVVSMKARLEAHLPVRGQVSRS